MRWPWSQTRDADSELEDVLEQGLDEVLEEAPATFTCTTCGRSDLPEAGDWDPPICLECDAAINFDADQEAGWHDER